MEAAMGALEARGAGAAAAPWNEAFEGVTALRMLLLVEQT